MKVSIWSRIAAAFIFPFMFIAWSLLCLADWLWSKITGRV